MNIKIETGLQGVLLGGNKLSSRKRDSVSFLIFWEEASMKMFAFSFQTQIKQIKPKYENIPSTLVYKKKIKNI